ncbi:SET and MYND domain-containing protein 4-like [Homarus americanus]|uniref:SET and MYND domain-containing protein 4-like 6 n=1 Tax=Homarus americanus TaxID=6706 RepID=A0A8J5JT58_HOMAM|nr:SET and MYND domain-containing protein 4-like [Homarus americanus]XP_042231167.1 SET and MYND domain-containing protein 4-like [Homarus americanus]XP_042231169.1 SET and MYND domain-containing protein 4-like [Homarus americanus]XP_042231170.1 SET and MYND domain-containing protein 4-like [Homarus americanus]XP_042231171.1 SET and MYND domain-containing protein 4-like [Homarus americanus]KAG7163862.1 SET and MYND domain-containing protein 4-like 6 [Homarus americanus]
MAPFRQLYSKFRGLLQESWQTNEVTAHFGPTATLDNMFQYLWCRSEAQQVLVPSPGNSRISRKGATESEKFRNEGNRLYRERKLEQALLAYNYSILAAPHPPVGESVPEEPAPEQESLALAYANRSAVLYEMGQFEAALADAQRAIVFGYPPARRHRLQERRAKCLQMLGRLQEAKAVLDDTINNLSSLSLNEKEAATVKTSLTKLLAKCEGSTAPPPTPQHQYERVFYTGPSSPPPVSCPSSDLPCLSDALRIHYTPILGRHLVAQRDIQPGEVLVVEEALAAVVKLDGTLRTHCSHCLRRCPILLPCPTCSLVVFCSEGCRSAGVGGGHGVECELLSALVSLQLDPAAALAFRVLTSTTLTALRATVSTLQHESGSGGGSRPMMQVAHNYRTLYHLEGHATARSESQLQETAAIACVLTRILIEQCPKFLEGHDTHPVAITLEDVVLVGGQLMRLILGLECNVHGSKEVTIGDEAQEGVGKNRGQEVGWSVYSALSLVNHSCMPNTLTTSLGSTKFLYSVSTIPQGAEITDSYGERYVSHGRSARRAALQQHYFFCCGCVACQADWPLYHELPMKPSLRCPSCCQALSGFTCKLCELVCTTTAKLKTGVQLYDAPSTQVQMNKYWSEYVQASAQINSGKVSPDLMATVVNLLMLLDKYTVHPNQAYVSAQETLMTCFDLMGSVHLVTN